MARLDDWVNMGRERVRGCPPGSTRHGEDDARDYIEHEREEHRFHVEYNGRNIVPNFAGLGRGLTRGMLGLVAEAVQDLWERAPVRNLCDPPAPLLPPVLPSPPVRQPFVRARRRGPPHRQSPCCEPEFGSANFRADFRARADWYRNHRDDEDLHFDGDNDSTTFFDPFDMPLGPRVRFA